MKVAVLVYSDKVDTYVNIISSICMKYEVAFFKFIPILDVGNVIRIDDINNRLLELQVNNEIYKKPIFIEKEIDNKNLPLSEYLKNSILLM